MPPVRIPIHQVCLKRGLRPQRVIKHMLAERMGKMQYGMIGAMVAYRYSHCKDIDSKGFDSRLCCVYAGKTFKALVDPQS